MTITALNRTRVSTSLVYLGSFIAVLIALHPTSAGEGISYAPNWPPACIFIACALLSLATSLTLIKPRYGYGTGAVASAVGLYVCARLELFNYPKFSAWLVFNVPPSDWAMFLPDRQRLLATIAFVVTSVYSSWRLLPARWKWRGRSLQDRDWMPALIVLFVFSGWFATSVIPYRVPLIIDADWPDVSILHVVKRGIHFHEERGTIHSHRLRYGFSTTDRKLFQYRFAEYGSSGTLAADAMARIQQDLKSEPLKNAPIYPARPLRSWNAEGWYVTTPRGVLAFTTENALAPPRELLSAFEELRSSPRDDREKDEPFVLSDVCLGFCYDPSSGLGIIYLNQRCVYHGSGYHCE